jgi:hypothetical protein
LFNPLSSAIVESEGPQRMQDIRRIGLEKERCVAKERDGKIDD